MTSGTAGSRPLPARAGIGLRSPHVAEVLATRPALPWLEVHPENYLGGGPAVRALEAIRRDYPLALHAVGLSVGSAAGLDRRHLDRVKGLVDRFEPALVSEHLAWSQQGGVYLNHLLPLPYTEESLVVVAGNVDVLQTTLGRGSRVADSPRTLERIGERRRSARRARAQAGAFRQRPLIEFGCVAEVEAVEEVAAIQVQCVGPSPLG